MQTPIKGVCLVLFTKNKNMKAVKEVKEAKEVVQAEMVVVMDPETEEVIEIDANKEKDWKKKYLHRSGVAFE